MFAQERHQEIRRLVREHRRLNFADLENLVGVSPATLRRDLTELEKSGDIIRVHGGVLDPGYVRSEISLDERVLRNNSAKTAIGVKVSEIIPPGSSVFIDAGSTCLEAGKILLARQDLRILTHSVALTAISIHGQADFICIGGELRRVSGALVGGASLNALSYIRTDFALIGASGLNLEGCSTTELSEAEMKKAILSRAQRKIMLADSTKWDRASTVQFAEWKEFDDWITDKSPEKRDRAALRSLGINIIV